MYLDHLPCALTEEQPGTANKSTQDFSDVIFPNAKIDVQNDVMISQEHRYPQRNNIHHTGTDLDIVFAHTFLLAFRGRGM